MLIKRVREFIENEGLLAPGDSVLAAVSGGPDSMALLHALTELRDDLRFTMAVAHLNHGLRGDDSEKDSAFVGELCEELGLTCTIESVDTRAAAKSSRLSVEEAARELRYDFLKETALRGGLNKIATGHTMDDQAETVLMRLIRGAGVRGLSAMKPCSEGVFIRPLLATCRSEVLTFLEERKISYREDPSNRDTTFLRNRIRHELLELLKSEYNPRIVEVLCSHASILGGVEDYLRLTAGKAYDECVISETQENIELELASFLSYHTCVRGYVLREVFLRLYGSLRNLDFSHVASLLRLASSGHTGDSVDVPSGVTAWLEAGSLLIGSRERRAEQIVTPEFLVRFDPGRSVWLSEISLGIDSKLFRRERPVDDFISGDSERAFFDFEKLKPPFVLRNLNPGDRISPFGMKGSKKVQDLLVDMKVPRHKRRTLAAFCDGSQILWVVGTRRGRAAPVEEETRVVLELRKVTHPEELRDKESTSGADVKWR